MGLEWGTRRPKKDVILVELNGRLGWRATESVDLSLNGLNLLHAWHDEFPSSQGGEAIGRSVMAEVRWRF